MQSFFAFLHRYRSYLLAFFLLAVLLLGALAFLNQRFHIFPGTAPLSPFPPVVNHTPMNHVFGGFSIQTQAEVANAAANGIAATLVYGYEPQENDALSLTLQANGMKIIDAMPWEYLYYFECQTHHTCSTSFPELTSTRALYTDITNHLQQEQNNTMIIGYWVLDDWTFGDGTARDLLVHINQLLHQYTPGKPSICGFPGALPALPSFDSGWDDAQAENFSPQGCDMVGLYIYAASDSTGTYDWTMSQTLPAVFASLQNRGWDRTKEPLVGIPQAFGGSVSGADWPVPNAQNIETQAKTYCQQGAIALLFYEWSTTDAQTAMTNPQIAQGINNSRADCQKIWQS